MRIVFMGTPDFAVPALEALVAAGHDVVAAYTQPPRPGGRRGRELVASPVQRRAEALGIEVRSPVNFREEAERAAFAALAADVAVVAAYGLILPQVLLDAPRNGCINIHASLLPRWRGAAPIQRAILAGDAETGVTIMQMERGLDTGPMLAIAATPITQKSAGDLTAELATLGAKLVVEVLGDLSAYAPVVQPDGATYATKIDKAEARLDFAQSADAVVRQVQAFNPPGAYFEFAGERVRVLAAETTARPEPVEGRTADTGLGTRASTGSAQAGEIIGEGLTIGCAGGAIRPTLVQRAGRGVMSTGELLRGFSIPAGTQL